MTIDLELNDNNLKNIHPKKKKDKVAKIPVDTNSPEYKKKKKKRIKILAITFFVAIIAALGFLVYKGYIFSHELGLIFSPEILITGRDKELKKDSSGRFTNILLAGLDTRESGGLLNTDTIIIASYDYKNNNITFLSIPRDFHVEVSENAKWFSRINSIYNSNEQKEEGTGMKELTKTVERIIDNEIQYYAVVDFKAFTQIIDAVGGVDINLEAPFIETCYPAEPREEGGYYTSQCGDNWGWWKTISFKAGPQTMNGETALKYARARYTSSDYDRAKRQQKVIIAIKDKLLSSESLTNPKTLTGILASISGNLKISDFTITDIEAALKLAEKYEEKNGKTYSFVLDPSIGNWLLVENKSLESRAYAIGPKAGLGKYDDIQEFLKMMVDNPQLYAENAKIMVYDTGMGFQEAKEETDKLKESYPYLNIIFAGTLLRDKEEVVIYQNNEKDADYSHTVKELSKYLSTSINEKPEYITSTLNGEDVTILLGDSTDLTKE